MSKRENFLKGFFKENPIFVYLLGMCPALAVTAVFETALGMGLLVIFVLTSSNIVVSLLRKVIPSDVRTPAYIVIIATFVTIVGMVSKAFTYDLYLALGVFIPLIVVNCLILGRAESFASKNNVLDSAIDGFGMGLGFTFALVVIGVFRELLATGGIIWGEYLPFFVEEPITLVSTKVVFILISIGLLGFIMKSISESRKDKANNTVDRRIAYLLSVLFIIFVLLFIFVPTDFDISEYSLNMFSLAPGAFIALGMILAFIQGGNARKTRKEIEAKKRLIEEKKKAALAKKAAAAKLAKEAA